MKIKIHLHNISNFMDDEIFIEIETDRSPCLGEILYLSEKNEKKLLSKIKETPTSYFSYKKWLYGNSSKKSQEDSYEDITKEDVDNFDIGDAIFVNQIALMPDNNNKYQTHIELNSVQPIKDLQ